MATTARKTRAEQQADTVRRLVDAAAELFLRDGYLSTSVSAVAARAGLTTGAVYANFAGKRGLALAVQERLRAEVMRELALDMSGPPTFAERIERLGAWVDRIVSESGWPAFELELALAAREDPELVEQLAERRRLLHQTLGAFLDQQLAETGATARLPTEELVRTLLGLGIGIAIQRMLDPTIPASTLPLVFDVLSE